MSEYGDNADIDGSLTVNESSADKDVRIESDGNQNMLFVDGGNNRVGVGTGTPDVTLHVQSAAGDVLKVDNTTAYGVTYGQLVKTDLTVGAGANPMDTTLNLPAGSVVDTVILKLTTVGGVSSGTNYNITNITLDNGLAATTLFSASFTEFSLIGNGSSIVSGTVYYFNNIQPNYPGGGVGLLPTAGPSDIKLNFSAANISTAAIMDVAVHYRKFDHVR
jgi:hypothetical protein